MYTTFHNCTKMGQTKEFFFFGIPTQCNGVVSMTQIHYPFYYSVSVLLTAYIIYYPIL